jgi:hypothetical protein
LNLLRNNSNQQCDISEIYSENNYEKNSNSKLNPYLKFRQPIDNKKSHLDDLDNIINDYLRVTSGNEYKCALSFWKAHKNTWPLIAELAQKMLGVPASSGAVERMFSISGHIYNPKRRKTGIKLFERLVFLKLNEQYM